MAMYSRGLKAVVAVKRRSATITEISFVSEEKDYTIVCSFSFGKCNRTLRDPQRLRVFKKLRSDLSWNIL